MEKHPVGDIMETTMGKLREMVDVNTIVGDPIKAADGITLIPVSRVSFGFASGGSEFQTKHGKENGTNPFGGASGAGVRIEPVSFLVIRDGEVKIIGANTNELTAVDKALDALPELIGKLRELFPDKNA